MGKEVTAVGAKVRAALIIAAIVVGVISVLLARALSKPSVAW